MSLEPLLRVRRQDDGSLLVSLDHRSAAVLLALPLRLRAILASPDWSDRVVKRLFPPAYRSPGEEKEYRRLLGNDLLRRKMEGIQLFEDTLECWKDTGSSVDISVSPGSLDLWLGFINDMRLVLGAALDIRDDSWGQSFDPEHPEAPEMALLHYLSWLEEEVLRAAGQA